MIDSLAPRVLDARPRRQSYPTFLSPRRIGAAIRRLFRVVLDAKFAAGPKFVLYFELLIFIVLGLCFTRVDRPKCSLGGEVVSSKRLLRSWSHL